MGTFENEKFHKNFTKISQRFHKNFTKNLHEFPKGRLRA